MSAAKSNSILKSKWLNGWPLFFAIAVPMSLVIAYVTWQTDTASPEGISFLIGHSVRWAVPFIFIVIAASSVQILFPGPSTNWLARNRKYLGLCFAVAMAWQGLFILIVSTVHRDHYFTNIYYFRDELEGTVGYVFLAAMVLTSFGFARKYTNNKQWKLIQKSGVYFLWAYPFSVYWWNLFYYPYLEGYGSTPRLWDYVFYALGFAAFAVRILAWGKQRAKRMRKAGKTAPPALLLRMAGTVLIGLAAMGAVTGSYWQDTASNYFSGFGPTGDLSLWIPFFPLEPFLPLLALGLGVMCWATPSSPAHSAATGAAKPA